MNNSLQSCLKSVLKQNNNLLKKVEWSEVENFSARLRKARRIFFSAQGRSGFILRAFCMRLIHLGFECFFVGETVCPPIEKRDMLITLSGSGETCLTCEIAKMAKSAGADIYAILGEERSPLAVVSENFLLIPGGSKTRAEGSLSAQPLGSLFEQSAFLLLESVAYALYGSQGDRAGSLLGHHSNLE